MNYASLITGGLTIFITIFWFVRQRDYVGPQAIPLTDRAIAEDAKWGYEARYQLILDDLTVENV